MTRASHYLDRNAFLRDRRAGSFWISDPEEDGSQNLLFFCPCGCGDRSRLKIGRGFKPKHGPSWTWNGRCDVPELSPSIDWQTHWHGWLRAGVWRPC